MVCILAKQKVRNEDLVLLLVVAVGEQITALQGLRAEAEDVVDDQDGLFGCRRSCFVCCIVSVVELFHISIATDKF